MLVRTVFTKGALLMCVALHPRAALSQTLDDFNGVYVYAGGQKQRAALEKTIESIVVDMNALYRTIARRRLATATKIAPRYIFKTGPDETLTITVVGSTKLTTKVDGTPIRFKNDKGQEVTLRRVWNGKTLTTKGDRGDAAQQNIYRLSADGKTLSITIVITSDPLPRPLRYSLTYKRQ